MAEPKTLTSFLNELKERGIRKQNQFQLLVTTGTAETSKPNNVGKFNYSTNKNTEFYRCILSWLPF
jgi:hypothetical protein